MHRVLRAGAITAALAIGLLVGGTASAALTMSPINIAQRSNTAQATTAIQQVIQHANAEQAQAVASGDPSVMADTSTADHLRELQQINQDLTSGGVTAIQLTKLEWGPISVTGKTATATTYETWSIQSRDGSSQVSRDTNAYSLVQDNGVWKIQSNDHPDNANVAPSTGVSPFVAPSTGQDTSHNWSGYATTAGKYTSVSGTWTVPQVTSNGAAGVGATWVGIGGVTSRDLIQAGTQETDGGSGRVQYSAWIEMLPQASRTVPFVVHPGDSVTVSISEQSANNWLIAFTNNTTGKTYQATTRYQSSHSSAEWVVEAPSSGNGILPLDNFGNISFTNASAVQDGQTVNLSQARAQPITMLGGGGQALAVPSSVGSDGSSFSVARTQAPATSAPTGVGRRGSSGPGVPFSVVPFAFP